MVAAPARHLRSAHVTSCVRWGLLEPAWRRHNGVDLAAVSLAGLECHLWARLGRSTCACHTQGHTVTMRVANYNFTFATNFTTLGQQGTANYYFAGSLTASVRPTMVLACRTALSFVWGKVCRAPWYCRYPECGCTMLA